MSDAPLLLDWEEFLSWEKTSRKCIKIVPVYVDMAGDLAAGVLLSQIVYWHLPKSGGGSRLSVERDGQMWLAKKREDWWAECRLKPRQVDRALLILESKGLIEAKTFHFGRKPVKHIRIENPVFLGEFHRVLNYESVNYESVNYESVNYENEQLQLTDSGIASNGSVSYIYTENTNRDYGQRGCRKEEEKKSPKRANKQTSSSSSSETTDDSPMTNEHQAKRADRPQPDQSPQIDGDSPKATNGPQRPTGARESELSASASRILGVFDECAAKYPDGVRVGIWGKAVLSATPPICLESAFLKYRKLLEADGIIERCGVQMKGKRELPLFRRAAQPEASQ